MSILKWIGNWMFGGMGDYSGVQFNQPQTTPVRNAQTLSPDAAIQIATVWACVDLLSRTMASIPCDVYLIADDGSRKLDTECNLHSVLTKSPSYAMTPFEFWQTMTMHWALRGNAYARINRYDDGNVSSLQPLNPDQMEVSQVDGRVRYRYWDSDSIPKDYPAEKIMHWKGMGNGIVGLSKLEYMRASVTESAYAQSNAVDMYAGRGKMNGILTADNLLSTKQKAEIAQQFQSMRSGGIPVLPASLKFQQLSLTPADTELLATRKFSVEEICRWFGVPSALINGDGGAAGSNIEQLTLNFYKSTVLPMCVSAEEAIIKRIPCENEKKNHQVRFRLSALNRSNDSARFQMYAQAVQNGIMTRNECRRAEDLPPVPGGDELTVQTNLLPIDMLGTQDSGKVPQKPINTEPQRQ